MRTIEKILGVRPTTRQVENEFKRRNLKISDFAIIVEGVKDHKSIFRVHGFQSSESATPEEALMKHMIVTDEISK